MNLTSLIPGVAQVKAALRFLPYVGIAVALLWGTFQMIEKRHFQKLFQNEQTAHMQTQERYVAAQAEAQIINKIQIERIEREYAEIGKESERKYNALLADNRAAVARFVRSQAAKGSAKGSGTGSTTEMPTGVVQDTTEAIVPVSDLRIAADNYSQLVALIEWAKGVGEVETATDAVQE